MNFHLIFKSFHSQKCIWKYCLQNVNHFVHLGLTNCGPYMPYDAVDWGQHCMGQAMACCLMSPNYLLPGPMFLLPGPMLPLPGPMESPDIRHIRTRYQLLKWVWKLHILNYNYYTSPLTNSVRVGTGHKDMTHLNCPAASSLWRYKKQCLQTKALLGFSSLTFLDAGSQGISSYGTDLDFMAYSDGYKQWDLWLDWLWQDLNTYLHQPWLFHSLLAQH